MATKLLEYTFNNTISDCIPQFIGLSSDGYTISDSVSDNITTRIINVNDGVSLPTRIWFADDSHPEGRSLLTLEYLNTSNINNMSMLFCYCNYLTSVNTIGWDTSKVTDMTLMFFLTSNLQNLTLSNFDITNCTSFYRMFEKSGIVELNFIGNSTNSSVGKNMSKMFADCNKLTKLSISNIPNINNMSWMFSSCSKLESLNLIGLDTSNCTDFTGMFYGCSSLTSLDLSSFNTSKANSMQQMFIGCNKITSLDLSNFNTSKVTDMAYMFQNCSSLTSLDLSSFNTSKANSMQQMFQDCRNLKSLDISNFNTSNSSLSFAFKNCKLEQIGMIYSDSTTINKVAENLYATSNCDIYYLDANPSELKPVSNVTYIQYKENVLYLPPTLTLRSNGDVHDEYNPFTSQFTQRIGEDGSVLENPVITTVKSIVAYNDTVKYGYALPDKTTDLYHPEVGSYEQVIDSATLDGTENWTKVNQTTFTTPFTNAKSETSTEVFTMKDDVESISIVNDTLSLVFKETSYVATNNIAVNALKIWLQTNNVEFKYELKERIFTDMTLEEFDFDNAHFVKPQAYKGGVMTQSNKDDLIFAPITYQTKSDNRYELPLLESNSEYTLRYEGSVNEVDLGGSTNSSVENNGLVQSGSANKVALFNDEVSNVMLIKGEVREQTIPYFQGLLSTESPVLKTTGGKNLFEGKIRNNADINGNTGIEADKGGRTISVDFTSVQPSTKYTITRPVQSGNMGARYYDCNYNFISAANLQGGLSATFTTPSNCYYFKFIDEANTTNNRYQIEKGVVSTPYEPHKTSILSTPANLELHSVGDDCDVLDCKTGELHRYYGKLTIDGSEKFEWHGINDEVYGFNLSQNEVNKKLNNRINPHKPSTCNSLEYRGGTMYNKKGEGFAISDADHAIVQVQLSLDRLPKLAEDGLRQYLSENPLHLIVPLLNPTVETVDLDIEYKEGDKKYIVRTHDDVTHVNVTSEGLSPITEIGYITNEDNVETVTLEDGMVTLENAKPHSVIQRAIMTGQTLVNLFNFNNEKNLGNCKLEFLDNQVVITEGLHASIYIPLKKSTTYTLFAKSRTNGRIIFIQDYTDHNSRWVGTYTNANELTIYKFKTFDVDSNYGIMFYSLNGDGIYEDVMVLEGDYTSVDIPYFNGMQSVKVPVLTTTGKNLFDESLLVNKDIEIEVNGHIGYKPIQTSNVNDSLLRSDGFRLKNGIFKKNTQYTLSCTFISDEKKHRLFTFKYIDGETGYLCQETNDRLYYTSKKDKTLETIAIISRDFNGDNIAICDVQLEESTVLTTYEPYKSNILSCNEDIELKSFEDLRDELNLLTGEMTQRVEKIVLDGSEDGWTYDGKGSTTAICYIENYFTTPPTTAITNYFSLIETRTGVFWNAGQDHEMFCVNDTSLAFRIEKTKLKTLDSNGIKEWLSQNPLTIQYPLATEIAKTIDLTLTQQNVPSEKMTYFKDYYGQLVSDGTLPKFTYRLESTNTYNVSQLKPNTLYTMYSEGEATVATLGGKASILLNNPQTLTSGIQNKSLTFDSPTSKVVLIEKDVTNQVVPYFTGTLDTVNPIIKTKSGNKSNTVSTNVHLRSAGDVCDTYDLNTGTLVKRVSEDHKVLDRPETSILPVNAPVAYHGATVEMSSNELSLLPRFEYSCKSPNYYPLPVESNEVYTLKFDKTSNGTLTMGGVTANTTGNQTITTKNSDVQGVLFSEDLGISNLMVMKTDVRNVPTPYFRGIQSVVNPTITVSNGDTQSNSVSLTLTMRSLPNGVKDELNLVTGEYIQRLDQRNFAEGDVNGRDMITDGTTTIYPLTVPRRSTLELNWSDGVLTAYDGTTNITSEAELLKPHLFFQLATSTLEEIISQLKDENASLLETVATLEEDNLSTMVAVTEVFEAVLVMMPMTLSVNNDTKGGGSYMVEVYVTLILKGKKTLEQVPAVIRPQVEQMLKDVDAL